MSLAHSKTMLPFSPPGLILINLVRVDGEILGARRAAQVDENQQAALAGV